MEDALARGRKAFEELAGIKAIWRQDCYALPTDEEHFGYNDGMGQPAMREAPFLATTPTTSR